MKTTRTTWVRLFTLAALLALVAAPALAAEPAMDLSPEVLFASAPAQCPVPAATGVLLAKDGPPPPTGGGVCGDNVCAEDQYCCNESCGICAPFGGACTQQVCFPGDPILVP